MRVSVSFSCLNSYPLNLEDFQNTSVKSYRSKISEKMSRARKCFLCPHCPTCFPKGLNPNFLNTIRHHMIGEFIHRNYSFNWMMDYFLDSIFGGTSTMFMNDPRPPGISNHGQQEERETLSPTGSEKTYSHSQVDASTTLQTRSVDGTLSSYSRSPRSSASTVPSTTRLGSTATLSGETFSGKSRGSSSTPRPNPNPRPQMDQTLPSPTDNVRAASILVNDDFRIGFYASECHCVTIPPTHPESL